MNAENRKAGSWALIVGATAYSSLMAAHPTQGGGVIIGPLSLTAIVHGLALLMQPVLLYGFWQLARSIGDKPLPLLGFCFYLLGAGAIIVAATVSGFVLPAISEAAHTHGASMPGPGPANLETLREQLQAQAIYSVWLNRTFASVHYSEVSLAILLWSIAWPSSRSLKVKVVRASGLLSGLAVVAWALSGTMTLEAQHGALLVTLVQMSWTVLAATAMLRAPTET